MSDNVTINKQRNIEFQKIKMEEPQVLNIHKMDQNIHTSVNADQVIEERHFQTEVNVEERLSTFSKDSLIANLEQNQRLSMPVSKSVMSKLDIANNIAMKTREERLSMSDRSRLTQKANFKSLVAQTSEKEREAMPEDIKAIYKLLDEYNGINVTASTDASKEGKMNIIRRIWRILTRSGKKRKAIRREEESLRDARKGILAALAKYGNMPEYGKTCDNLRKYLTAINQTMGMIPENEECKTREEKYKKKGWDMKDATVLDASKRKFQMTGEEGFFISLVQERAIQEKRMDAPLFAHEPCLEDIKQGALGDCWFLAALASVLKDNSQSIRDMMLDNADGTVTVRFFEEEGNAMKPYYVTVSKEVQTNYALDCFWVQIMEKAYAAFRQEHAEKDEKTGKSLLRRGKKLKKISDKVIDYGFIDGGDSYVGVANLTGIKGVSEDVNVTTEKSYINVHELVLEKMKQTNPDAMEQDRIDARINAINKRINNLVDTGKTDAWNEMANKYGTEINAYKDIFGMKEIKSIADTKTFIEKLETYNKGNLDDAENAFKEASGLPEGMVRDTALNAIEETKKKCEKVTEIINEIKNALAAAEHQDEIEKLRKDKESFEKKKVASKKGLIYPPEMKEKLETFAGKKADQKDEIIKSMSDAVTVLIKQHTMALFSDRCINKDFIKLQKKIKTNDSENILTKKLKPQFYKDYIEQMKKHMKGEQQAFEDDPVNEICKEHVNNMLSRLNLPKEEGEALINEWIESVFETMLNNIDSLPSSNYKEPQRDALSGNYTPEEDEQWEHMRYLIRDKKAILNAGSKGDSDKNVSQGVVEGHAYTVLDISEVGNCRFVHLRNPHAVTTAAYKKDEKTGMYKQVESKEDTSGVFEMEFSNFCKSYNSLYVNYKKGA